MYFILNENYFQFNKNIYKQNGGVPMGLSVSEILAELKLRKLEEIIIREFKSRIVHWFIHVDDIFAIIKEYCITENLIHK